MAAVDLSLLTDGLQAEREQGITIDVAYRYFATPKRKFIIGDTPGHEQYTRNMVTAASTANLVVILIDARKGVLTQTRRHTYLASLVGMPHIVLAVNKMDMVDYSEARFNAICAEYLAFAAQLGFHDVTCIPLSALVGDMLVDRGDNLNWYQGATLMELLENVVIDYDVNTTDFRYPVQWVCRPQTEEYHDFRGFMGRIEAGEISVGDEITVLPSGRTSKVKEIVTYDGNLQRPTRRNPSRITLTDEIDISRGDMFVKAANPPKVRKGIRGDAVLAVRNTARQESQIHRQAHHAHGEMPVLQHRLSCGREHAGATRNRQLNMNDIARVAMKVQQPLAFDHYSKQPLHRQLYRDRRGDQ